MSRQRLALLVLVTLAFLGGALLLYGQRTGSLTIFGDASSLAGSVLIANEIDLRKGIEAGDGHLQLVDGTLAITTPHTSGTAEFVIGNPEITQFQRFQTLPSPPLPEGSTITVQLAGSLDGISFASPSPPIPLGARSDIADTVDLTTPIAPNQHFLKVLVTLTSSGDLSPQFAGFQLDYEVLGEIAQAGTINISADTPADVSAATQVSINGTAVGSTSTELGAEQRREATKRLAATGVEYWLIGLVLLWLAASLWIFRRPTSPPTRTQE